MMTYTLSNTINKNRVFILQRSELEKRLDPNTYNPERLKIIEALKSSKHKLKPLRFVANFKKNIVKKISENKPYIGLENIESNSGDYIATTEKETISSAIEFSKGQVLFPKLRPYLNKVHFAKFDGICSTEFHVLNSLETSNEYLANFLRTNLVVNQTKYLMSGNTLPRLQTDDIENLLIPILPKETEEFVNQIMRDAFAHKAQSETEAENLLASIDDYLLDELGIKMPTENCANDMSSYQDFELNKQNPLVKNGRLFLTRFREIAGGRLDPFYQQRYFIEIIQSLNKSKYEVINFRHLINNLENGVEIRNYITDGGMRYLRVTDLGKNELNDNSMRYVETQKIPERIKLNNKCILISRSGSLGLINVFESKLADAILSSHIFKVELNTKLVDPSYIEAYLRSKIGQSEIFRNNNGGVIPEINQDALKSIHVIVPPLDKQQKIASQISIIRHQAQSLQKEAIQKLLQAKVEIEKMILG